MSIATTDYVRGGKQKDRYTDSEVTAWPCPLCGATGGRLIKKERGVLGIVECEGCSLMRVNPRLDRPDEIYRGDGSIYEAEFREVVRGKRHHRDTTYEHDLDLIAKRKPTGNFLDIGTNTGSFLRLARNRGWTLTGVEPSPQLGGFARKWWGLDIREGFIEQLDLPEHHYDVVTMTDVFEHVVNPREVLTAIKRVIKKDGVLFIKVPNGLFNIFKFKMRTLLGRPSDNDFDAYEHVCHYTDKTLARMVESAGWKPLEITVEPPVQLPIWHELVGHYYQHESPFWLDWKTRSGRELLYRAALAQQAIAGGVGYFAPNIGCFATPALRAAELRDPLVP